MADEKILCSYCEKKRCFVGDLSKAPPFCPSIKRKDVLEESRKTLQEAENQKMAQDVARTWKDYGYDLHFFAQVSGDVPLKEVSFHEVDTFICQQSDDPKVSVTPS